MSVQLTVFGWYLMLGCRSEDSQMDWLNSMVILRKYHLEITPPASMVASHSVYIIMLLMIFICHSLIHPEAIAFGADLCFTADVFYLFVSPCYL